MTYLQPVSFPSLVSMNLQLFWNSLHKSYYTTWFRMFPSVCLWHVAVYSLFLHSSKPMFVIVDSIVLHDATEQTHSTSNRWREIQFTADNDHRAVVCTVLCYVMYNSQLICTHNDIGRHRYTTHVHTNVRTRTHIRPITVCQTMQPASAVHARTCADKHASKVPEIKIKRKCRRSPPPDFPVTFYFKQCLSSE